MLDRKLERPAVIQELPAGLRPYKRTPIFVETTIPAGLRRRHSTKEEVWGLIRVLDGRLLYRILDPREEIILDPAHPGVVEPTRLHEVEPLGPVRFFVEFHVDAATAKKMTSGPDREEVDGVTSHG